MFSSISKEDISSVITGVGPSCWSQLKGARIFITGGTGFIGTWLIESLLAADTQLDLGLELHVLSRSPASFLQKFPQLKSEARLNWVHGDVTSFTFPTDVKVTHIFHAANDASIPANTAQPLMALDTMVVGTRRVLEFAKKHSVKNFLLTSSGGVYGKCPKGVKRFPEGSLLAPNTMDVRGVYGEGKRMSELLCACFALQSEVRPKIARLFALAGTYLPMDTHFALGNFIRDASQGKAIQILSDGRPVRSYLYATDMMIWLMRIWLNGQALVPYHVGSENEYTLKDLAKVVVKVFEKNGWAKKGQLKIKIAKKPKPGEWVDRYVPETKITRKNLSLKQTVELEEAIYKMALPLMT